MIANTPKPPYYTVIFTSVRTEGDNEYATMAEKILVLAKQQEGFLGIESVRNEIGITVSYWNSLDAIKKWKFHVEHSVVREKGRSTWYKEFKVRIAKVLSDYGFEN